MKRAAMWMLGWRSEQSYEQKLDAQQEAELEELIERLGQDRHAASAAFLDLPGIADASSVRQKATRLLERMEGMQLAQRDTSWVRALQLCLLQSRDAGKLRELAQLMATKQQWDLLAKHYDRLNVQGVLGDLGIRDLEALYAAIKLHAGSHIATPPAAKRQKLAPRAIPNDYALVLAAAPDNGESDSPAYNHNMHQVGDALAAHLLSEAVDPGSLDKLMRLRDLIVELYVLSQDHSYVTRLLELISSSCRRIDYTMWAETADAHLLQAVLEEFISGAKLEDVSAAVGSSAAQEAGTVLLRCPGHRAELNTVLAAVACVLGKRLIADGSLEKAGEAFRQARQLDDHPYASRSLLKVLLAQHRLNSGHVCHQELVELLAFQADWTELVERYDTLQPALREVCPTWNAKQLNELAGALEIGGRIAEAAEAHVLVALCNENSGCQSLAYHHFRHAFVQNPSNLDAEAGVCRLAMAAGRVEDAAAELLLRQASGSEPQRTASRVKAAVQLLAQHADSKAEESRRELKFYFEQRLAELGKIKKDTSTSSQLSLADSISDPNATTVAELADGTGCLDQPVMSETSEVTPRQPTSQVESASQNHTQTLEAQAASADASTRKPLEGQRLRKKYPSSVPVVCLPVASEIGHESEQFLNKFKFLVPEAMLCGTLKDMMHGKIALATVGKRAPVEPDDFTEPDLKAADSAMPLGKLYAAYRADDACLHFRYSVVRTMGGGLGLELFLSPSEPVSKRYRSPPSASRAASQRVAVVRSRALDHGRVGTVCAAQPGCLQRESRKRTMPNSFL